MTERKQFEAWYSGCHDAVDFSLQPDDQYEDWDIALQWNAWQARATIAQPVPATTLTIYPDPPVRKFTAPAYQDSFAMGKTQIYPALPGATHEAEQEVGRLQSELETKIATFGNSEGSIDAETLALAKCAVAIAQPVPEVPKDAAKEVIATGAKHSRYFSVVFKSNGLTQAEVEAFTSHLAFSAGSWSNLMHERDNAIAAQPVPAVHPLPQNLKEAHEMLAEVGKSIADISAEYLGVPAAHAQEPVAWQSQQKDTGKWLDPITVPYSDSWRQTYKVRPLYTAPPDAQAIRDEALRDCEDAVYAARRPGAHDTYNEGFDDGMEEAIDLIHARIGKPTGGGE